MRSFWLAIAGMLLCALPARAHNLGGIKVTVLFTSDGRFQIDALFDLDTLPPSLFPRPEDAPRLLQDGSHAFFDGAEVPLHPVPAVAPAPTQLLLRFLGTVPAGARMFSWSHALAPGRYLMGTRHDEDPQIAWQWLDRGLPSEPVALRHAPPPPTRAEVIGLYLRLGFTHILPAGLDHILFVLGLFLLSLKPRTILAQVTTFTVAHSITLGLTIYGVVSLSPRIVEPLIALSIVYVTVENLVFTEVKPWRLVVVFCFGLLHGMGFAGVLRELGLPRSEFVTALVSFNLGVEGGQLTVIALAYAAIGVWFGRKSWYRTYVTVPASALIALVGLYWTVQRVFF